MVLLGTQHKGLRSWSKTLFTGTVDTPVVWSLVRQSRARRLEERIYCIMSERKTYVR
jgi:hypothetical protein